MRQRNLLKPSRPIQYHIISLLIIIADRKMDASILEINCRPFFKCWQEASLFDQEMLFLPVWQLLCFLEQEATF